jgi:hypothetical protein
MVCDHTHLSRTDAIALANTSSADTSADGAAAAAADAPADGPADGPADAADDATDDGPGARCGARATSPDVAVRAWFGASSDMTAPLLGPFIVARARFREHGEHPAAHRAHATRRSAPDACRRCTGTPLLPP